MVISLLFRLGIKCENHTASIILIKEIFDIENDLLIKAKSERIDKQYYIDFDITKEDVFQMIKFAELFHSKIYNFIESLNQDDVEKYRDKLKGFI